MAAGAGADAGARDLDLAALSAENILAERVGLDLAAAAAEAELGRERRALARTQAERARAALGLKRAQLALATAQARARGAADRLALAPVFGRSRAQAAPCSSVRTALCLGRRAGHPLRRRE